MIAEEFPDGEFKIEGNPDARFIELASEVNTAMPAYWVQKVQDALNEAGKPVKGSQVLVLGVAYKKDVSDLRESPALKLIELLQREGGRMSYTDELVPALPDYGLETSSLDDAVANADCICIVTRHSGIDYVEIGEKAKLVVDFRNATGEDGRQRESVWKL